MQYHMRDFESAFNSYQEALRIRRQHLGRDDHPDIACTLTSIGLVLFKQDMFELAKKCFSESLRIRSKILGKDHRDVAILWYNIATIHFETGEDDLAVQMYKEL
jgi:tetratricopeptide (TPR) repeat protein